MVIDTYTSRNYLKYDRWDDGYIFRKLWEEHPEFPSRDVVGPHPALPFSHVVKYCLFTDCIEHDKGSHVNNYQIWSGREYETTWRDNSRVQ